MKRAYKNIIFFSIVFVALLSIFVIGSAEGQSEVDEYEGLSEEIVDELTSEDDIVDEDSEDIPESREKSYLILSLDTELSQFVLRDMNSTRQFLYTYNLATQFKDKYGELTSVMDFVPGRVVDIESVDARGLISSASISSKVWELDKVDDYEVEEDRGILKISDSNYRLRPDTAVFSGSTQTALNDIGQNDVLRVVGNDRDIWAITITTGHGVLSIINTSVFDNSLICIGDLYTLVKGDMHVEIPEGEYVVTVANNGYGGSARVQIARNTTATLDLETLKGEGPKQCQLTFSTDADDAVIRLDGKKVEKNQVLTVPYGRHSLSVTAEGYESWNKVLFVNSPTATISLEMTAESESESSTDKKEDDKKDETNKENVTTGSAAQSQEEKEKAQLEYLTTIRDMLSTMFTN